MKYISSLVAILFVTVSEAFVPFHAPTSVSLSSSSTGLKMGLFDGIMKAFDNEEVRMISVLQPLLLMVIFLMCLSFKYSPSSSHLTFFWFPFTYAHHDKRTKII